MINSVLALIGVLLVSYVVGSIPFGLIIGKLNGVDIRKRGSGNVGSTNITRTIGRDWGMACFALDFCKGLAPVILARNAVSGMGTMPAILAAAAAIAGHIWPIFLNFKGGKGVSTSLGALIALAPFHVIICATAWYLVFRLTRYVSVASIVAALVLPLASLILATQVETIILLIVVAALIIFRHRSNIVRLLEGTENRFERSERNE
ncbi:MAG: glycerol-3-phosphate 1-O-acyltransferase PlsY [Lentisphaeria bacterium]